MVAASMAPDHRRAPPLPAGVPGLAPPSRPPAPAQCGLIWHESSSSPPCTASPPAPTPAPASFTGDVQGGPQVPGRGPQNPGRGPTPLASCPHAPGPHQLCCAGPTGSGQHARAAPAVLCRPHRNPHTPGPHQLCCADPKGTPARQGRTSCAVQAPQEPPHARAAPAVLCRPHRNPHTPGPHQLCCAGPTGTPARQGRTSCAVQAPQESGSAPPRPRSCGSGARRQIAPSPVVGERRPEARGIGAPQVPEQVVPPASPPTPPPSRTGWVTLPPRSGGGLQGNTHRWLLPPPCTRTPPPRHGGPHPPPPSVVVGTRPASVTPADCSLAPCPGRACLAISPAGTCWVPSQQQQQQQCGVYSPYTWLLVASYTYVSLGTKSVQTCRNSTLHHISPQPPTLVRLPQKSKE